MTLVAPVPCPSCRRPMAPIAFERKLCGKVEVDLCFSCQGIWFDDFESLQITPGGVVELFQLIHQHRDDPRLPWADSLHCPRCAGRLAQSLDIAKGGRFNYYRCPAGEGRFTSFAQFMIEKGFVRQLKPAEIDALKARVQVIRCASCGAPVDIRQDSACSHCRSPIAILDPEAVTAALTGYRQAEAKRVAPDPEALAEAILATETERSRRQRAAAGGGIDTGALGEIGDLIVSGVEMVGALLDW